MNARLIFLAALLALLSLAGCAAQGSGGKAGDEGLGGKADCAAQDACEDAAGDSALAQLGLARFFEAGDSWTVAWVYRNDDSIHRDGIQQLGNATFQEPRLISYEVTQRGEARFGRTTRPVATVAVASQTTTPSPFQTLVGQPFNHVDERVDYTINALFNPVAKEFFALDQLGRTVSYTVDLDGRSNLTMQFDSVPNGYPNIDRIKPREHCDATFFERLHDPDRRPYTACWDAGPDLPPALEAVAEASGIDYDAPGVHFGPTDAQPDYMFWQPGRLHPTFVSGPRGHGILVSQSAR